MFMRIKRCKTNDYWLYVLLPYIILILCVGFETAQAVQLSEIPGMARRNKVVKNVKIESVASGGKGLARADGKVIFVDYGVPGDEADVRLTRNKKDYAEGVVLDLLRPSELRIEPFCEHFFHCGGCRWQHLGYPDQLRFKAEVVEEAFRRTGGTTDYELLPILGCEQTTGYRNKFEYTFSRQGWFTQQQIDSGDELERRSLGFHVAGQFQRVVHVNHCHLQDGEGNRIREQLYRYALESDFTFFDHREQKGLLRNLTMRFTTTGQRMLMVHFGEDNPEAIRDMMDYLAETIPGIDSLQYVINTKGNDTIYDLETQVWKGADHIVEELGDVRFRIGPKSFFQTNSRQAKTLYDVVAGMAGLQPDDLLYDLYTGIGSIALYLAGRCREVVGVETVPEAVADALVNAELNGVTNAVFEAGSSERVLSEGFLMQHGKPDVVITDPPRAGMHRDVIDFLKMAAPRRIVYVSCNPVTQARDTALLAEEYRLVKMQPVDMFPHTYHIENVALLERR